MDGFLAMGGYGAFVWSAYAVTFLVLGGVMAWTVATLRRRRRELEALERTARSAATPRRRLRPVRAGDPAREEGDALP